MFPHFNPKNSQRLNPQVKKTLINFPSYKINETNWIKNTDAHLQNHPQYRHNYMITALWYRLGQHSPLFQFVCKNRHLINQDTVKVGENPARTPYLAPTGGVWKPSCEQRKKKTFLAGSLNAALDIAGVRHLRAEGKNSALGRSLSSLYPALSDSCEAFS